MILKGYRRGRHRFGIRNKLIVLSSVCCVNSFVEQICVIDNDAIPIIHQHGCDHIGKDREQVLRTLVGICNNPNVGGVLLIGLGCESINVKDIELRIDMENKLVKSIVVQEIGNKEKIISLAKRYLQEIKKYLIGQRLEKFDLYDLIVGLQCGASDPFSGITANPAVGLVSDKLVQKKATVILAEIPEMIGAEKSLSKRIYKQNVKRKLFSRIKRYIEISKEYRCDLLGVNPTPGNIRSGLSSIEEKSLGCIAKGGKSIIQEFVEYADMPRSKGLVVMDTPGNDPESITGIVAGGAQVVLFTTGLGTPLGNPIAPIIKIASNNRGYRDMKDYMDINAGQIIDGVDISVVADKIYNYLIAVCNGEKTSSERNCSREFAINRIGPTF